MKILISNSTKTPIYVQLENQIRDGILEGRMQPEEALPSIRGLARDLGISVITVKRAYDDLEAEGYIHTVGGKGSFVAGQSIERLREKKLQTIEAQLADLLQTLKTMGVPKDSLHTTIDLLWEGE